MQTGVKSRVRWLLLPLLVLIPLVQADSVSFEGAVCPHEAVLDCTAAGTPDDPFVVTGVFSDADGGVSCGGQTMTAIAVCSVEATIEFRDTAVTGNRGLQAEGEVRLIFRNVSMDATDHAIKVTATTGEAQFHNVTMKSGALELDASRGANPRGFALDGVDVLIRDSFFDARGAKRGLDAGLSIDAVNMTLHGATGIGIGTPGNVTILRSHIRMDGDGDPVPYTNTLTGTKTSYVINAGNAPVKLHDNLFEFPAGGLLTGSGRPVVDLEGNKWMGTTSNAVALDIRGEKADGYCQGRVSFNDFYASAWFSEGACTYALGPNFWAPGTRREGSFETGEMLPRPIDELPQVVATVEPGYEGQLPARIHVATDAVLEASLLKDTWENATRSNATPLEWVASEGVQRLYVRACKDVCGRPVPVTVATLPRAVSPVALLDVDALSVPAGTTVSFDASRSFQPDGLTLSYRFFDQEWTAWGNASAWTAAVDETRTFRLEVRDPLGQTASADVTVEVVEEPVAESPVPLWPVLLLFLIRRP